ncbi:MAG: FkbM family methyltransferase [bacterium]|nr:FkbM family methyltransferase [bacterium]
MEVLIPYDNDLKIQINTGSVIEWQIFFHGYYEPEIVHYIKKYLRKEGVFVDVGANVGVHSLIASKIASKVIALEPVPEHLNRLKKNCVLNNITNISFLQLAASDKQGEYPFYIPIETTNKGVGSMYKNTKSFTEAEIKEIKVDVRTLDEILKGEKAIDFIKIDTEGSDGKIIMGSAKTIEKFRPVVIFEYSDPNFTPPMVTMEMVKKVLSGYSFIRIGKRKDNCNFLCLPPKKI